MSMYASHMLMLTLPFCRISLFSLSLLKPTTQRDHGQVIAKFTPIATYFPLILTEVAPIAMQLPQKIPRTLATESQSHGDISE
jgi:hypothetical protein